MQRGSIERMRAYHWGFRVAPEIDARRNARAPTRSARTVMPSREAKAGYLRPCRPSS